MRLVYGVDGRRHRVELADSNRLHFGANAVLSRPPWDVTCDRPWYRRGYSTSRVFSEGEFARLKAELTDSVGNLLRGRGARTDGFSLEGYHRFVDRDDDHRQVVSATRALFPSDFGFDLVAVRDRLSALMGFPLSDRDPDSGRVEPIVVRVNRPRSTDFNPPHKDVYEVVDGEGRLPRFVNFWIPVAGVTSRSSLPIVPGSHLLPESRIERTTEGATVEGNDYRVRCVASWNARRELLRAPVEDGEVLVFSSFLIHGLAINEEPDTTRVALELRLYPAGSRDR